MNISTYFFLKFSSLLIGRGPSFEQNCNTLLNNAFAKLGWNWSSSYGEKENIRKVYDEQRTRERQTMDTFLSENVAWAFGIEQLHRLFTNFFEIYVRRHLYAFNYHDCTIQQACMIIAKDGVFFLFTGIV